MADLRPDRLAQLLERRTAERALHPNPSFGAEVRRFEWDTEQESSPIRDRAFADSNDAAGVHQAMLTMYERLPFGLQTRLAGVFTALDYAGQGATIVHCTAGKDRTGFACALILHALGVADEVIAEDYLLTNTAGNNEKRIADALGDRLPPALLNRPKWGFGVPLAAWFRGSLRELLWDNLTSAEFLDRGLVSPDFLRALLEEHATLVREFEQELKVAASIQQALLPAGNREGAFFSAAAASVATVWVVSRSEELER